MPQSLDAISGTKVGRKTNLRKFLDAIPRTSKTPYYTPAELAEMLHCIRVASCHLGLNSRSQSPIPPPTSLAGH